MKYLRRMMSFLAKRLVLLVICCALLVCAFYMALNTANIYILLSEGMEKRVSVTLTREDAVALNNYFTYEFLDADPVLESAFDASSPYSSYTITDFKYKFGLEWLWAWPWSNSVTCTVTEQVPSITGTVKTQYRSTAPSKTPPAWQGGRYQVTLVRTDGAWKIAGLKQTGIITSEIASPTPAPAAR